MVMNGGGVLIRNVVFYLKNSPFVNTVVTDFGCQFVRGEVVLINNAVFSSKRSPPSRNWELQVHGSCLLRGMGRGAFFVLNTSLLVNHAHPKKTFIFNSMFTWFANTLVLNRGVVLIRNVVLCQNITPCVNSVVTSFGSHFWEGWVVLINQVFFCQHLSICENHPLIFSTLWTKWSRRGHDVNW